MKIKQILLGLSLSFAATYAQAQVKVGSNPGTISSNAVLDVEGTNGSHSVILQNGNMGVGTVTPTAVLDVNAAGSGTTPATLHISNLATIATTTSTNNVVIDAAGNVGQASVVNVAGQFMRFGLTANSTPYASGERALRFNLSNSNQDMGLAPNGQANYINTINGASGENAIEAVAVPAGNGTPSRTTDRIQLPSGIYRLTMRLVGSFTAANAANAADIKIIVNNNEYAYANGVITNPSVGVFETGTIVEYLNLEGNTLSLVDFTIIPNNPFNVVGYFSPGTGNSWRSVVLIERIK